MTITRRGFLKHTLIAGGGLTLGFSLSGCGKPPFPNANSAYLQANAFIQVTPSSDIILQLHKVEMGQGAMTGLVTLVAEELDIHPRKVLTEFAGIHTDLKDPDMHLQVTGGSTTIASSFLPLREAAATVREMLKQAAAKRWALDAKDIIIHEAKAQHSSSGKTIAIGDLVTIAQGLKIPNGSPLVDEKHFKYIGQFDRRIDIHSKVNGAALYSIDIDIPGALTAVVVRCPHIGGNLSQYDDKNTKAHPGVVAVFPMNNGLAVVADSYWHARKAADKLIITWDKGESEGISSASILTEQRRLLSAGQEQEASKSGEYLSTTIKETLDVEYRVPYLAHATMEPLNAVVSVTATEVKVWAGNQGPDVVRSVIADVLDRPRESITVHTTLMGGGFGRRIVPDYIAEAAVISDKVKAPIKLIWSREDDTRHDYYRPAMLSRLKAEFDNQGKLYSWYHHIVGASISGQLMPVFGSAVMPDWVPHAIPQAVGSIMASKDFSSIEGAYDLPYRFLNKHIDYTQYDPGLPVGYWRSVGHSQNAFFVESFVDEVANHLKIDPLLFRKTHLSGHNKHLRVLNQLAQKANWGHTSPTKFKGIAIHESFGSVVGQVAEISVDGQQLTVHRIICVIDCGQVINPDVVTMQMESGINFGLTAAMMGEITLEDLAVQQSNFHDYPMLRIHESPDIEVHIIESNESPKGVGEPAVPPVAPAVANALFAATGQRLRSLPLRLS